jgi:hypothetical protein
MFIDSVSSSDPNLSTRIQLKKINKFNEILKECQTVQKSSPDEYFVIPGGDGMCIGFFQGIDKPLRLAIEFCKTAERYNKGIISTDIIQVRIGLNEGNCFTFSDFNGTKAFWGSGIIFAKRIMDLANNNQILVSQSMAESLQELSDEYRKILKPLRDYELKHGHAMLVYSAYGEGFGNPDAPTKQEYQKSKFSLEVKKMQNSMLYPEISIAIDIKDSKTMLVHHKRTYKIGNKSDEPIKFLLHGIGTDVPVKSFSELNLKVYEESKEMKLSSINLDNPYCKEFSTVFEEPVKKSDQNRQYTLEYDVKEPERFYENTFLVDSKKFFIQITFPDDGIISNPQIFEVDNEKDTKTKIDVMPTKTKENSTITMNWEFDNIVKGQIIKIEW